MSIDRPMNEYEGALFSAVMTLIQTLIEMGADRQALATRFRESANFARKDKRENDAAVSDMLANIAERDTAYIPKPPFRIIEGGKDEPPKSN